MADKIIRVLAKDAPVKASAITAKEMVERARQIHKTLPVATAALGRSLTNGSFPEARAWLDGAWGNPRKHYAQPSGHARF